LKRCQSQSYGRRAYFDDNLSRFEVLILSLVGPSEKYKTSQKV
jgi:hypothetical protein